ncbi:MAG: citrate:proton symporter [Tissierellia bacterium]|nr:citrate:proton symporter [Tissierellia bacterium]
MLSAVGFLMVLAIIILLLKGKMSPIVVLVIVPTIAALIIGTPLGDLNEMVKEGIKTVSNNSVLFIFSIIFFCIMSDVGVFDIIVNRLVKIAGNNVIAITVATGIIGIIAHLDGATATTVLITIPTMYPIYKRMGIRPHVLLCLTACAMGVMNLLPWGGPVARAATVLGVDATDLWLRLIPIQVLGCVLTIGLAIILGSIEKKRGAGKNVLQVSEEKAEEKKEVNERNQKLLPFNVLLTIAVIGVLVWDKFPSYYVFMLGLSLALVVNYPTLKGQEAKIKEHAASALIISATMLSAGIMVGIMDGTGMIEAIAHTLTNIIPTSLGRFIHLIFGFTALPMGMLIGTDAYFFGLMPPIIEVGKTFGVDGFNTAMAMLIGKNVSLMISPLVPATFLSLGLVNMELKDHIKFSFKYLYTVSIIMIVMAVVMGIITL